MGTTIHENEAVIGTEYAEKIIPLIDRAKSTIDILMFDWRWKSSSLGSPLQLFNQSIVRAVRRGVKVRACVNSGDILATLCEVGCDAKKLISKNLLHTKLILVDKIISVIGSHNLTSNAMEQNFEASVILYDPETSENFSQYFERTYLTA